MEQVASVILFLGLLLFGLLFLLLSLRSQVRHLKQQVESLTSLANTVRGRVQALEVQSALLATPPSKSAPKVKKASEKPKRAVVPRNRRNCAVSNSDFELVGVGSSI